MIAVVYQKSDGLIQSRLNYFEGDCFNHFITQDTDVCIDSCPSEATHIIAGVPTEIPLPNAVLLERIRVRRNSLLAASDWTQVADAPVDKAAWAAYRQALRDFPGICDPVNPVWPVAP
jgi:hypothetical protein